MIVGEPPLLDGGLVLLLLCEAQKSLPISCLDSYFFCHNSNILVISAPLTIIVVNSNPMSKVTVKSVTMTLTVLSFSFFLLLSSYKLN